MRKARCFYYALKEVVKRCDNSKKRTQANNGVGARRLCRKRSRYSLRRRFDIDIQPAKQHRKAHG